MLENDTVTLKTVVLTDERGGLRSKDFQSQLLGPPRSGVENTDDCTITPYLCLQTGHST